MKRILAVFLSMLILTLAVPAALATKETSFSDVPISHWAFDEIETAVDKGITNGYSDGTFKPANSVTKNQFAVMLSRAFFPEDVAANQKIDDGQPWYWANLKTLNDRGLLEGTNLSDPNNWATRGGYSISRYEMAVLMYNILGEFGKSANAADMTAAQSKMSDWHFISPDYRYFRGSNIAPALFELLDSGAKSGLKNYIYGKEALETYLNVHCPEYVLWYNSLELSGHGKGDVLSDLLAAFGYPVESEEETEQDREKRIVNCIHYYPDFADSELLRLPK